MDSAGPTDLQALLAAGAGVCIDAGIPPATIQGLASQAVSSGTLLIIRKADKIIPAVRLAIAAAGKGRVIFDFSD